MRGIRKKDEVENLVEQHAQDSDDVELPENTVTPAGEEDAVLLMEILQEASVCNIYLWLLARMA
jgi:hypothetical protein